MIRGGPITILLALACTAPAVAQSSIKGHDSNAPADVTADHIEVQDKANRAIFTGSVHVVQGDMTMDAARMTVAYRRAAGPNSDPEIQRIDASGGVKVVDPSETATGSYGIYDLDKRVITLIGNVVLIRGDNKVNGARMVMDLNSGRSTVDSNVVGGAGATTHGNGRVTGHFTVPKRDNTTGAGTTTTTNGAQPAAPKPAASPK
ncbi:LptA/OstA family protein [Sphingomonas nostoxanthinifaciens]|uniref:LptA/OstA family protein n=1 Tax=Sphingomonas nostoxanthinifaciens TaxID=2872652 RepID=UPI001CC21EC8|nr:LptA/OstA family protein [Sphingomonas nostoxanthinifaciens]UAK24611.1 OstA family protein [Sphingomonas nostoxanthinifaciens]